jgi:hypothetical protein
MNVVQVQKGSDYFVRLGPATPYEAPPRQEPREGLPPSRRKRRRVSFRLRPLSVVGLFLVGWLAWAATTPGGVSARLEGISDKLQSLVDDATTDPGLKRAATYYNDRYQRDGAYPRLSEQDLRDDPDAGWGVGVETEWCSNNAIVLRSLTGGGTISRLLLSGNDLGDVHGQHHCPADLSDPLPWKATG